ncbi:hypothetical protein ICG_04490 [Bacillus cereus BAG1X1-3]|nr:hypothetical protein ICG_04490 [Bacillus cereus BAG1X1-3]EOO80292.1 hypothetical protein IC7_00273 [Bacillus cereus BAG1O-1]EOP58377.1 hypothetical protein IKQ_00487 [Bacillus cereus VDM053]SEB20498.1 hypothetical protein SAMN04488146_11835 [Bacillus nitratireducens]
MINEIVWGSPGSLLCLGFFLAGLGVFIRLSRMPK